MITLELSLVPKLHLGTHLSAKFRFAFAWRDECLAPHLSSSFSSGVTRETASVIASLVECGTEKRDSFLLRASFSSILSGMPVTTQETVLGVLNRLPPDAPLEQVARELEFIVAVREGFAQLDRGEGIPLDEVERLLPTWTRTIPPTATK